MVVPVGVGEDQEMKRITKLTEDDLKIENLGSFRFVPMLKKTVK